MYTMCYKLQLTIDLQFGNYIIFFYLDKKNKNIINLFYILNNIFVFNFLRAHLTSRYYSVLKYYLNTGYMFKLNLVVDIIIN